MKIRYSIVLLILITGCRSKKPEGFVYVHDVIPDIEYDIRYYSSDNFMGTQVDGYKRPVAYMTRIAAEELANVQADLKMLGLGLKIFDAYRPQQAVDHFIRWAKDPGDTLTKAKYYPDVKKDQLFDLGYISEKSGHSRGSTVDLTIIKLDTKEEMDMGSPWDFFGKVSHYQNTITTKQQNMNRAVLRHAMGKYGFVGYENEWWHFTYTPEPFPNTYFDFTID